MQQETRIMCKYENITLLYVKLMTVITPRTGSSSSSTSSSASSNC